MFDFTFIRTEFEAINNLIQKNAEQKDETLPNWIYIEIEDWVREAESKNDLPAPKNSPVGLQYF